MNQLKSLGISNQDYIRFRRSIGERFIDMNFPIEDAKGTKMNLEFWDVWNLKFDYWLKEFVANSFATAHRHLAFAEYVADKIYLITFSEITNKLINDGSAYVLYRNQTLNLQIVSEQIVVTNVLKGQKVNLMGCDFISVTLGDPNQGINIGKVLADCFRGYLMLLQPAFN